MNSPDSHKGLDGNIELDDGYHQIGRQPEHKSTGSCQGMVIIHMEKISQISPIFPSPPALSTAIMPVISIPEKGQMAANTSIKFLA